MRRPVTISSSSNGHQASRPLENLHKGKAVGALEAHGHRSSKEWQLMCPSEGDSAAHAAARRGSSQMLLSLVKHPSNARDHL